MAAHRDAVGVRSILANRTDADGIATDTTGNDGAGNDMHQGRGGGVEYDPEAAAAEVRQKLVAASFGWLMMACRTCARWPGGNAVLATTGLA